MESSGNISGVVNWDADQRKVIQAPRDARIFVDAGPGTGKTAVACTRLAYLISEHDVEPNNTWMISFTRTAVAEIRARLHTAIDDKAFDVRIATVDSHAWAIHSGYDPRAQLTGSYEDNIDRVIELLRTDEDVQDELLQIDHVVVDEAQDLVGVRADLVCMMLKKLQPNCGITIFADRAQAIYGFSNDDVGSPSNQEETNKSLLDRLREIGESDFRHHSLKEIHRTSSPGIIKIFSELRRELLDPDMLKPGMQARTAERIQELAGGEELKWRDMNVADFDVDDLILFRTRAEVLMASQFCKVPHRLRLSGYNSTLPSWLALCFFDFTEHFVDKLGFMELWSGRIEGVAAPEYDAVSAWDRLVRIAGENDELVDMAKLRRVLSRSRPPVDLALSEYGLPGPVVGTIHASKGRESPNVVLILPSGFGGHSQADDIDEEAEEARVLFVGATRAKSSLIVGTGARVWGSSLSSKRTYRQAHNGKTMIEVGCQGDIVPRGLVGREVFSLAAAVEAQSFLAKVSGVVTEYSLYTGTEFKWRHFISPNAGGPSIGMLTENLKYAIYDVMNGQAGGRSLKPPQKLSYVRGMGGETLVLAPDDGELEWLHEPWASSGFMLAPKISAFPSFTFFSRRRS